jgi:pyruvate,orthophosphate dikinase
LPPTSGDARFAWDSYRRFIQMYSDVVLGLDHHCSRMRWKSSRKTTASTTMLNWGRTLAGAGGEYKAIVEQRAGRPFPQDVHEQLWGAIRAVFDSWDSDRAKVYRRLNDIPGDWGTAVNVQAMVFGNMGDTSATGVAFTRDPATGERAYYGEWLVNAQGEDVVAGIRTPQYLTKAAREAGRGQAAVDGRGDARGLWRTGRRVRPAGKALQATCRTSNSRWSAASCGCSRPVRASAPPRPRSMAVDMVGEGLIDEKTAIRRIDPMALDQLLHPTLDPKAARDVLTAGLPASPGAASGAIVLDADTAERAERGEAVILVRVETSPEDIHGMHAAKGILTARGGMTVTRRRGCARHGPSLRFGRIGLSIDMPSRTLRIGNRELKEGDIITLDGTTGRCDGREVPTIEPELVGDFGTLMGWADKHRRMKVRTNAETPADCRMARQFGAEGVGLCRTEHMFFDAGRISRGAPDDPGRDEAGRRAALAKLLPEQRADFPRSSRSWRACRSRSACSIRRCTNSCRTRRRVRRAGRTDRHRRRAR